MGAPVNGVTQSYVNKIKSVFEANGGRLFLADSSKSVALRAAACLPYNQGGFLAVTYDRNTANDIAEIYSREDCKVRVIGGLSDFEKALTEIGLSTDKISQTNRLECASKFKKAFSAVAVVFCDGDDGSVFFNRELFKDESQSGTYNSTRSHSRYCVSDFLADAGYGFVLADEVYKLFSFERQSAFGKQPLKPSRFDRIDFLGERYFCPSEKSYRRLKKITSAAKYFVAYTDTVFGNSAVSFYAVLKLLHDDRSAESAVRYVRSISTSYTEDCDQLCTDVSYCREDENILSGCLRDARGSGQRVPRDLKSMREYICERLDFMTKEETFVCMVQCFAKAGRGRTVTSLQNVVETLESYPEEMTRCFVGLFFGDGIKGELESTLTTPHISAMDEKQLKFLFEIFCKYGVCRTYKLDGGLIKALRIYHEDSGFEYYVRAGKTNGAGYSAYGKTEDSFFKALALTKLIEDGTLKTPVLAVCDKSEKDIFSAVDKLLPSRACDGLYAARQNGQDIIFTCYGELRSTASVPQVNSAVFLDALPNAALFRGLADKTLAFGVANAVILTGYGDLNGKITDDWYGKLFENNSDFIPAAVTEISLKDGIYHDYAEVARRIDGMYVGWNRIISQLIGDGVSVAADYFNKLISDFTIEISMRQEEIMQDMRYLDLMGSSFDGVFRNSFSVDGAGEHVVSEQYESVLNRKAKNYTERKTVGDQGKNIFFNVCGKMLRRTCDLSVNYCADCKNYGGLKVNDFKAFKESVKSFFEQSAEFAENAEKERLIASGKMTIRGADEAGGDKTCLIVSEINEYAQKAEKALAGISKADVRRQFSAPYKFVDEIRRCVGDTYSKILNKYYGRMMEIFRQSTEKMALFIDRINQCRSPQITVE